MISRARLLIARNTVLEGHFTNGEIPYSNFFRQYRYGQLQGKTCLRDDLDFNTSKLINSEIFLLFLCFLKNQATQSKPKNLPDWI